MRRGGRRWQFLLGQVVMVALVHAAVLLQSDAAKGQRLDGQIRPKRGQVKAKRIAGRVQQKQRPRMVAQVSANGPKVEEQKVIAKPDPFAFGAVLETDPDFDRLIGRVRDYLTQEKHREAVILLQHVIDESGTVLSTNDGRVYQPVRDQVEHVLATLPAEALALYRLMVDGEAAGLMHVSGPLIDEASLTEVVRRYFISSHGDDAAYALGCMYLDQYDFISARRLFRKILEVHPDPTPPRSHVLVRLAVASARVRDLRTARAAWRELERGASTGLPDLVLAEVKAEVEALGTAPIEHAPPSQNWPMDFGTPRRDGYMPNLAGGAIEGKGFWTVLWDRRFPLVAPISPSVAKQIGRRLQRQSRPKIVGQWQTHGWWPTSQAILYDGKFYFKSHQSLICCDAETGQLIWEMQEPALTPGAADETGRRMFIQRQRNTNYPATAEEVLLFGDRLAKSMALFGQTLYHIEGQARRAHRQFVIIKNQRMRPNDVANSLAAHDAATGKLRWRLGGGKSKAQSEAPTQYLAAPLLCGDRLVLPMEDSGSLYLLALDPETGDVIWKAYLCSEPVGGGAPWSPVGTAVDGNDVFVASGRGAVFHVNGIDGAIGWACRYERLMPASKAKRTHRARNRQSRGGLAWDQDTIILRGDTIVVLPSDANSILFIDRYKGVPKHKKADRRRAKYCLGLVDDHLFVAGRDLVRCYDVSSGQEVWETKTGPATGRGALTAQGIYIPVDDTIKRVDLGDGQVAGEVKVAIERGDPIGNLFSGGGQLYALGMERAYALVDTSLRLAVLDRAVAAGDTASYLARARLRRQMRHLDGAVEDFDRASSILKDNNLRQQAKTELFDTLLALAQSQPHRAEEALQQAQKVATAPGQHVRLLLVRGTNFARHGQVPEAIKAYLRVARDRSHTFIAFGGDESGAQVLASQVASLAIANLMRNSDPDAAVLVKKHAHAAYVAAQDRADVDEFVTVMRTFVGTRGAARAAQAAAVHAARSNQFERAEMILREQAHSSQRAMAATALAALAHLHENAGWLQQAMTEWEALKKQYRGVAVLLGDSFPGLRQGDVVMADKLAQDHLENLEAKGASNLKTFRRVPSPPFKRRWAQEGGRHSVFDLGGDEPSQFLEENVFVFNGGDSRVSCRDVATGRTRWGIPMLGGASGAAVVSQARVLRNGIALSTGQFLHEGHIGLFWSGDQVTAYGLISGKKLWTHHIATPQYQKQRVMAWTNAQARRGTYTITTGDGMVAIHSIDPRTLIDQVSVLDATTGELRWVRRFGRPTVDGVSINGGHVNVLLNEGKEVWVGDSRVGVKLGRFSLDALKKYARILWTSQGLIYANERGLIMRSLPKGTRSWMIPFSGRMLQIGQLDDRTCYAIIKAGNSSKLILFDLYSGKRMPDFTSGKLGRTIQKVMAGPGRDIYVSSYAAKQWHLSIVDAESGRIKVRMDLGGHGQTQHRFSRSGIEAAGHLLPIYVQEPPPAKKKGRTQAWRNLYRLGFHHRKSGALIESMAVPSLRDDGRIHGIKNGPMVKGDTLILASKDGIIAIGHDPGKAKGVR